MEKGEIHKTPRKERNFGPTSSSVDSELPWVSHFSEDLVFLASERNYTPRRLEKNEVRQDISLAQSGLWYVLDNAYFLFTASFPLFWKYLAPIFYVT